MYHFLYLSHSCRRKCSCISFLPNPSYNMFSRDHTVVWNLSDPVAHTCVAFVIIMVPGGTVIRDTGDNFQIIHAAVIYENGEQ